FCARGGYFYYFDY
nr:immunoglobulin heavy chain junction region [Mus musculus]